jgi:hypothetical protein
MYFEEGVRDGGSQGRRESGTEGVRELCVSLYVKGIASSAISFSNSAAARLIADYPTPNHFFR